MTVWWWVAVVSLLGGAFVLGHLHGRRSMAGEMFDAQVNAMGRARREHRAASKEMGTEP